MSYKETLNLPKTEFPMKANLPNREPDRYAKWFGESLPTVWDRMKKNRESKPVFTLHDGPPYANGSIHIGHALNKILKDFVVKYNYFNGKQVHFTPGWDCHGLPIEKAVLKEEDKNSDISKYSDNTVFFRNLCAQHANRFINEQRRQFKSLGVVANWDDRYSTSDRKFEANVYRLLCCLAKNGLLYEKEKPVYWSWKEKTALAEAEIEYKDHESHAAYIAFPLTPDPWEDGDRWEGSKIVIWTTTPWTLAGNTAIALNPEETYVLTEKGHIVAKNRYDHLIKEKIIKGNIIKEVDKDFFGESLARNPLVSIGNARKNISYSAIIYSEYVTTDEGTGCVHIAPGHGEIDYEIGIRNGLPVVMPVDEKGCYDDSVTTTALGEPYNEYGTDWKGMHVFEANELIIQKLKAIKACLRHHKYQHTYPYCSRSDTPVIFRATNQWFIPTKQLIPQAMKEIESISFTPETAKKGLASMVEKRPDWCVSRQRNWGVPIAFFRHKQTGNVLLNKKILKHVADEFEKHGTTIWFQRNVNDWLAPLLENRSPDEFEKVTDILDVWFDSGATWHILNNQADLYLEGRDQYRGWFSSSLFLGVAQKKTSPFKSILCHGFVVDEKGHKMAKRDGNVVSPDEIIKKYGSEVLRLWVAMSDYTSDLRISDDILKNMAEEYRKIRNTFRFLLSNLSDYHEITVGWQLMVSDMDSWILTKARGVFDEVHDLFGKYEFAKGMHKLLDFIHGDLSGIYLNSMKDRLYCNKYNGNKRRGTQTVMYFVLETMIGLLAPILTYTVDEVLEHAPERMKRDCEDIFDFEYRPLPGVKSTFNEDYLKTMLSKFHELVDKLKKEGVIKDTLELGIDASKIAVQKNLTTIPLPEEAENWFVVSQFSTLAHQDYFFSEKLGSFSMGEDEFGVFKIADRFKKCKRCWRFKAEKELCQRCENAIK
jgi:isoleucyl-tRNA synthetase